MMNVRPATIRRVRKVQEGIQTSRLMMETVEIFH
jgi:hypothetical protein